MVIAQIVEADAPGGTERLVLQIAQDLRQRGHRVVVVGPADGPGKGWLGREVRALGFDYETIPKRSMLDPRSITDITRLIRKHTVDVVHSHEFAPSVFGAMATWLTRRTHVFTTHGNLYFAAAWRRKALMRWAARHSDAVVSVSRDTADDLERLLELRKGAVHVIANGIMSKAGERQPVRAELGLKPEDVLLLALGNVSERKNHIAILRALEQLQRRRPELQWHLAIAGTDQGKLGELREFARVTALESRVHFLGHRGDTENLLAASDIFVMSSLHEGMPLAIMEAMFASKPVITSVAGGIGEMITEGVEGMLTAVNDDDAMARGLERLLSDASLRQRLGAAARERAQRQFGIAPMVDAYMKLYLRNGRPDA